MNPRRTKGIRGFAAYRSATGVARNHARLFRVPARSKRTDPRRALHTENPMSSTTTAAETNRLANEIAANGLNGFLAGTPADFVGFFAAIAATKPDSPKPTPVEQFLGSHPATLAWVMQPNPAPVSFATQAFFGNNAFVFVGETGKRQ